MVFKKVITAATGFLAALSAGLVNAVAASGHPEPWQMLTQAPAASRMEEIVSFHNLLLVIITAITLLVLFLLVYVVIRFRKSVNATPSKTSHNTLIEILWTVVPILILVVIAIPSFKLLYYTDRIPEADMTIKAVGHQWYWSYEYPDHGDFAFDAFMIEDADIGPDQLRLLSTDNQVVVPVGTTIRVIITSTDVLHSWAVPALGIKTDAVPGRLNETWFNADRVGTYYGQCSELCGVRHGFMPIEVKVVSQEDFDAWLVEAREEFAAIDAPLTQVALAARLN